VDFGFGIGHDGGVQNLCRKEMNGCSPSANQALDRLAKIIRRICNA
jgi:hypothetical protein